MIAGWNHIDQLAVCVGQSWYGPGFTPTEQASQVALWAVLASPLIVSFDVRTMDPSCKALVLNPRVIAVHQDKLGSPGKPLKNLGHLNTSSTSTSTSSTAIAGADTGVDGQQQQQGSGGGGGIGAQVWGRALAGGGVAAVFFNRGEVARDISATFTELGLPGDDDINAAAAVPVVRAVDVWSGKVHGKVESPFTALAVPPHAAVFITFTTE